MNQKDFELEPPGSLREFVLDTLVDPTFVNQGAKETIDISDQGLDKLMEQVYAHIERQALSVYHSNESWALRRWALENILKDEVVNEVTAEVADGLVSPILDWQKEQSFDPLAYYQNRLVNTLRRKPRTVSVYIVTAARFVGMIGRKRDYTDEEVLRYLDWAGEHFKSNNNSYVHECVRLVQFLRNLPGANPQRKLPIEIPDMDEENLRQSTFSDEEVEQICWATVLDRIRPGMVLRLAIASIYGGRKGEICQLSSEDIHLNGDESYIYIRTLKKGTRKRQPIPTSLIPLFSLPIQPVNPITYHCQLKRVVQRAGVLWRYGTGTHSMRRNVVTLIDIIPISDIDKHKFMRWAVTRHLGMLDRYRQKSPEVSDGIILSQHPRVKLWEAIIPYLAQFNPYCRPYIYNVE